MSFQFVTTECKLTFLKPKEKSNTTPYQLNGKNNPFSENK